jgi:hypothetical protein
VCIIKENAKALIVARKENGLKVNANRIKYMVMPRDHNAGRSHNIKNENNSFESVAEFKYLGTTLTIKIIFRKKLKAA